MHTGHVISGAGHAALIGWLLLGDIFASEPPPFEAQAVSMVSGAAFEALLAAQAPPDSATEVAQPPAPEPAPKTPELSAEPDTQIVQPPPLQAETPPIDPAPEAVDSPVPPEAEVADAPPDLTEPAGEEAVLAPDVAEEAAPQNVERVAPEPVAQPDPEATPDPVEQQAVTPDAQGEAVEEAPQEATAPEAATTEIVTEATKAPAASLRPPGRRPAAPAPQLAATAEPTEPAETPDIAEDIAAAVAAAQTDTASTEPTTPAPVGPPLTAGERNDLRLAVSQCWNVGSLSSEALNTTVVVSVSMNPDGTPIIPTIALKGREGGSEASARQAFEAARRAIIRCGARGYQLPAEKYAQWQEIEITFNPDEMRRR